MVEYSSGLTDIVPAVKTRSEGTVLFLDDDEQTLTSLKNLFTREEGTFIFCNSVSEALDVLRNRPVDVVVTDLHMPEANGVEFLKRALPLIGDARRIIMGEPEDSVLEALAQGYAEQNLTKPWRDTEFRLVIRDALRIQRELRSQRLLSVLHEFNNLPSSSHFQGRLQSLLNNEEVSIAELVSEIEKDPSLVAKILQIANSVYFWVSRPVTSVRDAIAFIGIQYVRTIITVYEYQQALRRDLSGNITQHVEKLWLHAARRSMLARRLSEEWKGIHDTSLVYLASLFLDVGYIVRVCTDRKRFEDMLRLSREERLPLLHADMLTFSIPHDQVGSALLELWNFPREVIFAVANHHGDSFGDPLTQLVQVAEVLASSNLATPHDPALDPVIERWKEKLTVDPLWSGDGALEIP